jgi:hypothetical protein
MTNAPASIIFIPIPIPVAGSQEPLKRMKPRPYPVQRRDQWPHQQAIPRYTPDPAQIEALKRQGREIIEQVRAQRAHG